MPVKPEKCTRCSRLVGASEVAFLLGDHVLCGECYRNTTAKVDPNVRAPRPAHTNMGKRATTHPVQTSTRLPACDKCRKPLVEGEFYVDGNAVICQGCYLRLNPTPVQSSHEIQFPLEDLQSERKRMKPALVAGGVFGVLLLLIILGVYFISGGFEREVQHQMRDIESQAREEMHRVEQSVAQDAEKQYWIARQSGSAMDAHVHAGLTAAAYLQAKDEVNYGKWKAIEREEARRAGLPDYY